MICRSLDLLLSYDQLNLANTAGAECLNRRKALKEGAHKGNPEAPRFEAAEEFMGT